LRKQSSISNTPAQKLGRPASSIWFLSDDATNLLMAGSAASPRPNHPSDHVQSSGLVNRRHVRAGSDLTKAAAAVLVLAAFSGPPCAAASGMPGRGGPCVAFATAAPSGSVRNGVLGARLLPAALCVGRVSRAGPLLATTQPGGATVRPWAPAWRGGSVPEGLTLAPALWVEGSRLMADGDAPTRGEILAEVRPTIRNCLWV